MAEHKQELERAKAEKENALIALRKEAEQGIQTALEEQLKTLKEQETRRDEKYQSTLTKAQQGLQNAMAKHKQEKDALVAQLNEAKTQAQAEKEAQVAQLKEAEAVLAEQKQQMEAAAEMTTLLQTQVNELEEQARGFAGLKQLLVKSEGKTAALEKEHARIQNAAAAAAENAARELAEAKENAARALQKAAEDVRGKNKENARLRKELEETKAQMSEMNGRVVAAEAAAASAEAAAAEAKKEAEGKKFTELAQVAQKQKERIAELQEQVKYAKAQGRAQGRAEKKKTSTKPKNKQLLNVRKEEKEEEKPRSRSPARDGYDTDSGDE